MEKYLTHIPVDINLCKKLKQEFYNNASNIKKYTAKDKTLNQVDIMRHDDMKHCVIGNSIAERLTEKIGHFAKPRYVRVHANSFLKPHVDYGTASAINVILEGTAPIVFDEKYEIHYKCAALNVQETHSVRTPDTRLFFRLSFENLAYNDLISLLNADNISVFEWTD